MDLNHVEVVYPKKQALNLEQNIAEGCLWYAHFLLLSCKKDGANSKQSFVDRISPAFSRGQCYLIKRNKHFCGQSTDLCSEFQGDVIPHLIQGKFLMLEGRNIIKHFFI
jgi:hypothetical protein